MLKKKEKLLIRFKDGQEHCSCLCFQLLQLRAEKLQADYDRKKEEFERARQGSKQSERHLNSLLKASNKLKAIREVIAEIK